MTTSRACMHRQGAARGSWSRHAAIATVFALGATASSASNAQDEPARSTTTVSSASLAGALHDQDATPADLSADATYVLPGALNKDISVDMLRRRFGAQNVTVTDIDGAEGEVLRGVVLFENDPLRRAEIFPQHDSPVRGISSIRVSGTRSRWRLDNGVHLGMTLDDLVKKNGKPVSFSGLDWDYGGGISDWHGGRLAPRDGDNVFRAILLTHGDEFEADSFPIGDSTFRSDDKRYPKQGSILFVGELMVSFPGDEGG
ncbi:hypothetical protein [Tahibacter amnicola]|uniref:Uncharacterized protein n=1 Tax=Tahibacter amnicola TaxID=2976241 RepID=A0ABY6B893_9GAMM|nr:hypothetical protein [Tahibacter amnicola]UXI65782.1 hypothetical protein N4264_13510 [Tahibacter amnicola]